MVLRFFPFIILSGIMLFSACGNNSSEKGNAVLSGSDLYQKNCSVCHGDDGKKGLSGASNLSISKLEYASIVEVITNGRKIMPPFKASLNTQEIEAIAKHVESLKTQE
ncbi:MAG: c-type cytochrome [Bacteroidia bacterium]